MRLVNIKLTNFRRYESVDVDLPDGLTGILGINGAGKSTLLEAVGWALYGNPAARTDKEDIRRQGSGSDAICRVELTFELGGIDYTVVREMRGRNLTSDASVASGGDIIARGAQPALAQVDKLLGMDRDSFFVSFFARQRELNALSDYKPADRKSLVIKMLGIDDIDTAIELAKEDGREKEIRIAERERDLGDPVILQARLMAARTDEKAAAEKLSEEEAQAVKLNKSLTGAKKLFDGEETKRVSEEKKRRDVEVIDRELARLQTLLSERRRELDSLNARQKARDLLLPGVLFAVGRLLKNAETELAGMTAAFNAAQTETKKTADSLSTVERELAGLSAKSEEAANRAAEIKDQEARLVALGPDEKCPTCGRPLGKDMPEIRVHFAEDRQKVENRHNELEIEIRKFDSEKRRAIASVEEAKQAYEEARVGAGRAEDMTARLRRLNDALPPGKAQEDKNLLDQSKSAEDKLTFLTAKRDELAKEDAVLVQLPELTDVVANLERETGEKEDKKAVLTAGAVLAFDRDSYDLARQELDKARDALHHRELAVKDAERDHSLAEAQVKNLTDSLAVQEKAAGEIKELRTTRENLAGLINTLKEFRRHLIGRIRPTLAEKAGELLADLTDGRYEKLELNEDYEIFIWDGDAKYPVGRYSGGEKDLANLCLRLAISLSLADRAGADYGFIVLDEIFGSQDDARKMNIIRALTRLNKRFRQIFLITHVDDIKDEVEHALMISEAETGLPEVTLT